MANILQKKPFLDYQTELGKMLVILTKYRNICAHGNRLFNAKTQDSIPDLITHKKLHIPKVNSRYQQGKSDLFTTVISLKYLLNSTDFRLFYYEFSTTYLLMKRGIEAANALRTAFDIRMEFAHLGLTESHDSLQQMMNLINILLLAKDVDNAKIVLKQYKSLVLKHLSDTSLDYGICKLSKGIINMMEGTPESAEVNLLTAESIIGNAVGRDNDYMKTTYRYQVNNSPA